MKTNIAVKTPAPKTHGGAKAVRINAEQELRRSVMGCLLFENGFYEDGVSVADRIAKLVAKVKPEVAAAIALEARTVHNLRHAPLWIALAMTRTGGEHRKLVGDLLPEIMLRADEPAEFLAMYWKDGKVPLAKQVKIGLAKALTRFNEYQLAKYNRDGAVKLRDVLFLSHAKPISTERLGLLGRSKKAKATKFRGETKRHAGGQGALWTRLAEGKLETPDTWEVGISAAKTVAERKAIWTRLISEGNLGALALLRNLRNMLKDGISESMLDGALRTADYRRVLPFRFIAAARANPSIEPSVERAMFKSLEGVEKIGGKTVVLVDVSGSMSSPVSRKSDLARMDAAAGVAMIGREMFENVRVFTFSDALVEVPARKGFALWDAIIKSQPHSCTYLGRAIEKMILKVGTADRLIVITDEQTFDKVSPIVHQAFDRCYMINVGTDKNGVGYGKWTHIDGFSEAVLKWVAAYEASEEE